MGEYKFQELVVYKLALIYIDQVYKLAGSIPEVERYNLSSQLIRAATSIALNIAEGSTGQSDTEQARFLGLSLRSYIETVACLDLIQRREYLATHKLDQVKKTGNELFYKLFKFRKALRE